MLPTKAGRMEWTCTSSLFLITGHHRHRASGAWPCDCNTTHAGPYMTTSAPLPFQNAARCPSIAYAESPPSTPLLLLLLLLPTRVNPTVGKCRKNARLGKTVATLRTAVVVTAVLAALGSLVGAPGVASGRRPAVNGGPNEISSWGTSSKDEWRRALAVKELVDATTLTTWWWWRRWW
jgi:hypothetical protein